MSHHKRHRPKSQRAGCIMCKPHKHQAEAKRVKIRGLRVPRKLQEV